MRQKNNFCWLFLLMMVLILSSCDYGNGYRIEGNRVVYERPWNTGHGTQIINVKADAKTFQTLGNNNLVWAKDKNYIFNEHHILDFLDPNTFELLNQDYGKDKYTVVCGIKSIVEADVETFKVKKIKDNAGKSVVLGIDKSAAYECGDSGYVRIATDWVDEFRPIEDGFYRDRTHVWWHSILLEKAKADNFRVIGGGYATDGNRVFYRGREVVGADVRTFKVTSDYHAKDKNYKYEFEDRVD